MSGGHGNLTKEEKVIIKDNLFNILDILEDNNIAYWIDYGTLLGAARDGKIITWDNDADIGCYTEDYAKIRDLMIKFTTDTPAGFHRANAKIKIKAPDYEERSRKFKHRRLPNGEFPKGDRNLPTDIFFWKKRGSRVFTTQNIIIHDGGTPVPSKYFEELSTIEFEGRMVSCPNNPVEFLNLKKRYGKDCLTRIVKTGRSGYRWQ